jgi:hypothetical protein
LARLTLKAMHSGATASSDTDMDLAEGLRAASRSTLKSSGM